MQYVFSGQFMFMPLLAVGDCITSFTEWTREQSPLHTHFYKVFYGFVYAEFVAMRMCLEMTTINTEQYHILSKHVCTCLQKQLLAVSCRGVDGQITQFVHSFVAC